MRAFVELWDEITRERYGVEDPKMRRFRYGVQVNSLGLTEAQPENNVQRIVLEMLGVTLSKNARARAVQLPAWNEALGLPRPVGPAVVAAAAAGAGLRVRPAGVRRHLRRLAPSSRPRCAELVEGARAEMDRVQAMGGAIAAVESGYMKQALVSAHAARRGRIESGEEKIVGVNSLRDHRAVAADRRPRRRDHGRRPRGRAGRPRSVEEWKAQRDEAAVAEALARLAADAKTDTNLMAATLAAARAGATTGEWAGTLREVFGEFRAPTGVSGAVGVAEAGAELTAVRERVRGDRRGAGRPAAAAGRQARPRRPLQRRRAGRRTRARRGLRGDLPGHPADPGADRRGRGGRGRALRRALDPVRLAHGAGARRCSTACARPGSGDVPVIVGGIIPDSDGRGSVERGVAAVYTPKDFGLTEIMAGIVEVIRKANGLD